MLGANALRGCIELTRPPLCDDVQFSSSFADDARSRENLCVSSPELETGGDFFGSLPVNPLGRLRFRTPSLQYQCCIYKVSFSLR